MKLSDLELTVMGVVARDGPCTAYAIRHTFLNSASPRFSGSAGAIYPLVERLTARRLIRSRKTQQGRRKATEYTISKTGRARLRDWLRDNSPRDMVVEDPLHLKLLFSEQLSVAERREWIARTITGLEQLLSRFVGLHDDLVDTDRRLQRLVRLGVIHHLRGRIQWLGEVREIIDRGKPVRARPPADPATEC